MKSHRPAFNVGGDFRARKTFRFHGKTYGRGDLFPWRTLSCSERKLAQLYDNGFLTLEDPQAQEAEAKKAAEELKEKRRQAGIKSAETRKRKAEEAAAAKAAADDAE